MEYFHVLNRGANKLPIVQNNDDRMRFVRALYVFNDRAAAPNAISQPHYDKNHKRTLLVHIHAWCLMKNHYHLLVSPIDDDMRNLSLFMKKLNGGYAKFINEKYTRSGCLWQGRYKKILLERDGHFLHIPYYIHLNPLDYSQREWRTGDVADSKKALHTLLGYRWSSFQDYNNIKNFPSILHTSALAKILGSSERQKAMVRKIINRSVTYEHGKELE